jgi:hypothetical protein
MLDKVFVIGMSKVTSLLYAENFSKTVDGFGMYFTQHAEIKACISSQNESFPALTFYFLLFTFNCNSGS